MVLCSGGLLAITLLLLESSTAGFSCLNNPCIYGICMDDLNSSFTCYCIDGYTGVNCQTNWDECWSSPCMNGGLCHDGVASYNCSCPEGFMGETCEENVDECSSNPCHNNATCIDAANSYICQCAPGYSGTFCEIDIAVCNSTEDMRCYNGGVCIEGPGIAFSCFCTPGWTGKLCEDSIDECVSNPCQNGGVCIDLPASYSCACLFGYTGHDCDLVLSMCPANPCENNALCIVEEDTSVCYCVPDYHGDRCQYQYDECLLGPGCKNGGTCIDGVDSFSCSCPPDLTGQFCECVILNETDLDCSFIRSTTTTTALSTTTMSSTSTTVHATPFVPTTQTFFTTTEFFTTLLLETSTQTEIFTPETTAVTESSTTETTEVSTTEESSIATSTTIEPTEPATTTEITEKTTTEIIVTSLTLDLMTTEISPETETSSVTLSLAETSEYTISTTTGHTDIGTVESRTFLPDTSPEPQSSTITIMPTEGIMTEPHFATATDESTTLEPQADTTTTEDVLDCTKTPCLNGGICYFSQSGPKCKCKKGWSGGRCDRREDIDDAAFIGHSYLSHRLANSSATAVSVVIRTLAPEGMLIHANTAPHMYLAVYLHDGLLKFVFSCGIQTMLFSELHERVNTGFQLSITAMLEVEGGLGAIQHCSASLTVNDSLVMSGEQQALGDQHIDWSSHQPKLHLGGVPSHLASMLNLPVTHGITGCMHSLKVDGGPRKIFTEAVDMFEVSQCSSLACLSSPCHGTATCVEQADTWSCLCPSGYLGPTCEKSVCENNPCHYGGTCAPYPGSGFICLCPFGKHGLFCHKDLEIGHPLYTSSVRGLSSFTAYPLPGALHHSFEMRFRFIAQSTEQVALLLFIGQENDHDSGSDHLAISYIKGYVVLTWNLGSGPRRIFTPQAVFGKVESVHIVKFGRVGRQAWLQVDNMDNITGTSPGIMTDLNTQSMVYIGGHKLLNFTGLPHDLPLHTGFTGCVYGVEFRAGQVSVMVSEVRAPAVVGRNVGQCGTSHCHNTTCLNGGACLDHGATYTCLCKDGWFGPVCALRHNPCDTNRHNCSHGSTCVPLESDYQCDCPFGRIGDFCEKEETLTDVGFTGSRSYLALPSVDLHVYQMCVEFELKPSRDRGLVLFTGHPHGLTFMSIALHGGILELRFFTVGSNRRSGEVLIVRSGRVLSLANWHLVRAGRYGNRVFLWVDGAVTAANLQQGETLLPNSQPIFIGGVPDFSQIPHGAMAGLPVELSGCVRRLALNWRPIQLTATNILSARNLEDCDGTACGGDVCMHAGTCWLDTMLRPHCTCTQEYTGERCESIVSCLELPCENGGQCLKNNVSKPVCQCPVGWEGSFCTEALPQGPPHFVGDSYLVVDPLSSVAKRGQDGSSRRGDIHSLFITFSTAHPNGVILWSAQDDEYVGVGVEKGLVKLAWAWRGKDSSVVTLLGPPVSDGNWHELIVNISGENVTVRINQGNALSYLSSGQRAIVTDGIIHLGGFPQTSSTVQETRGIFTESFQGCVREVGWNNHSSVTDFTKYQGHNVRSCPIY